ncbi:MAG TPA: FAD-dependent monooxygenase [Stellaceae bacterium]|nr:FAD-dependent monooxygenase [Stellaceae bacterium]
MEKSSPVIVAGAGIAGLCLALVLKKHGVPVRVLEQAPALTEVGAGIQISSNGMRVLRWLGLEDEMRAVACNPAFFRAVDWRDGHELHAIRYREEHYQLHRADLLGVLKAHVPEGVVQLDERLTGFTQTGATLTVESDHARYTADALIGADGIHSTVRRILFGADQPRFAGHICWRFVVDSDKLAAVPEPATWHGPHGHVVMYPVSAGRRVNVVAYIESSVWFAESWHLEAGREEVHRAYPGWDPAIRELIDGAGFVNKWAMFERDPLPRWTEGRVTLMGDAAHPMLPYLAQGAVMAIEDAYALGTLLAQLPSTTAALEKYQALRLPRATAVQRAARSRQAMMVRPGETKDGAASSAVDIEQVYAYDIVAETAEALRAEARPPA